MGIGMHATASEAMLGMRGRDRYVAVLCAFYLERWPGGRDLEPLRFMRIYGGQHRIEQLGKENGDAAAEAGRLVALPG